MRTALLSAATGPPVVGIHGRQVVLALARHLQARLLQGCDDIRPVPYRAVLDTLEQIVPDQVAGGGLEREAGPQLRRLDVGAVPGLLHPRPRRLARSARTTCSRCWPICSSDTGLVGGGGRAGRAMEARVQYRPTPQRLQRLSPGP